MDVIKIDVEIIRMDVLLIESTKIGLKLCFYFGLTQTNSSILPIQMATHMMHTYLDAIRIDASHDNPMNGGNNQFRTPGR